MVTYEINPKVEPMKPEYVELAVNAAKESDTGIEAWNNVEKSRKGCTCGECDNCKIVDLIIGSGRFHKVRNRNV